MPGSAADLLASLRARGLALTVKPVSPDHSVPAWRLVVSPSQALTDADRAALALHREALLDLLYREQEEPVRDVRWPAQSSNWIGTGWSWAPMTLPEAFVEDPDQ